MLKQLFKKQAPAMVGIDVGTHSIKAVLLSQQDNGYQLDAFAIEAIPKGVLVDREVQDIEALARVMERIRKKMPKSVSNAVAAVSGSTVITKVIYMDVNLSDEDLEGQIEIEADSLIPYPLNEVSLDFEKLSVNQMDPSKTNVLLSAARTESIESLTECIDDAGFTTKVVDVESYALSRACTLCLAQIAQEEREGITAQIDIGASMTLFSVVENGENIYTRDQVFGGEQYTQSIMSYYNRGYEESEKAKVGDDLPNNYNLEVLVPFQTQLLQQIRRSVQMFLTTSGRENIDNIILSGGSSLIAGIEQVLIEELGIHTVLANPFVDMQVADDVDKQALEKVQSQLMVASGLALRSFSQWHI